MTQPEPDKELAQYYEQLGVTPDASLQDIRSAYGRLYLAYESDSLDRQKTLQSTPFAKIQEAYDILKQHSATEAIQDSPSQSRNAPSISDGQKPGVFDPEQMQAIRAELEQDYQALDNEYQEKLAIIEALKQEKLTAELLDPSLWEGLTASNFWISSSLVVGLMLISLGVMVALGHWLVTILGLLWLGFWGLVVVIMAQSPRVTPAQARRLAPIQDEIQQLQTKAKQEFERKQAAFTQQQQEQVAYFMTLPPNAITDSYIQSLSPRQQFYLLRAIQKRQDQDAIKQNLKTGAKILVGVGLLAAIFTGLPFF